MDSIPNYVLIFAILPCQLMMLLGLFFYPNWYSTCCCQRQSHCNNNNNNNQTTLDLEEHSEPSLSHQQQSCLALVLSGYAGVNGKVPCFIYWGHQRDVNGKVTSSRSQVWVDSHQWPWIGGSSYRLSSLGQAPMLSAHHWLSPAAVVLKMVVLSLQSPCSCPPSPNNYQLQHRY